MKLELGDVVAVAQLVIGFATLLYLVFGVSARIAVTEFKVDQLWHWHMRDRSRPRAGGEENAGPR